MKQRYVLAMAVTSLCISVTLAKKDHDGQSWNGLKFEQTLFKGARASVAAWFRTNDDMARFCWQHSDIGLSYALRDWVSLGANYWHIYKTKPGSPWSHERRWKMVGTFKLKLKPLSLSDRSMFEYRVPETVDSYWVYRNKLTATFPLKAGSVGIKPHIAEELFVDFELSEVSANRIYAGVTWGLLSWLSLTTDYFWQASLKNDVWEHSHVMYILVKVHK